MPIPPSSYSSGPVFMQQLNTDLYGTQTGGPSGVAFHAQRPLLSETVYIGGTAYTDLVPQPVQGFGCFAYTVIDTTALSAQGADNPGTASTFRFKNFVPGSYGAAGSAGGWWLTWNFPRTGNVTVPPGGVGAGMSVNSIFRDIGVFQYGSPAVANTPYYLDLAPVGYGSTATWQPSFYWLTPSTPTIVANASDTSGITTRMGFAWHTVQAGGSAVPSVPSVAQSWGTVTSPMLNGMGSALAFLNNPPALRCITTTGQGINNSTNTIIQFNAAPQLDNYAGWSTAVSSYTAPLPGMYLFSPTVVWGTASSSGIRWSGLLVHAGGTNATHNGPVYAATPVGPGVSGAGLTATAQARILSLNAGDTVQAVGFQNAGVTVPLYTGYNTRLIGAYMGQQAAAGTTLAYTPPVTGFRFQAGALAGTALTAALNARIGGDLAFLLNRPYFTGFQATSQSGFANNSGFHQVNIDTLGALPRGGNGDSYGGWDPVNHRYASQVAGWYLVLADLYPTPPASGTAGVLTAGIFCSTSGGITPSSSPDNYQQVYYPVATGGPPPGGFAAGMYYLQPGEYVYPMLNVTNWGGTWGTFVSAGTASTIHSQFSCFYMSE